jgi:hypothetical protein
MLSAAHTHAVWNNRMILEEWIERMWEELGWSKVRNIPAFSWKGWEQRLYPWNSRCLAPDFNTGPPVYKVGTLPTQLDYPLDCALLCPGHPVEVLKGFIGSELKRQSQY